MTVAGTAEEDWASWPPLLALPRLPVPTGHIVVISAHPDDEVLGAGGLLAALAGSRSATLEFVTVTDGEASHGVTSAISQRELADRRAGELTEALAVLGHQHPDITRLRLPDSAVAAHADELASGVERSVAAADLVMCPSATDGHIDHDTVGRVTTAVCAGRVPVWEFPIWTWHWTSPDAEGAPWARAGRLDLSAPNQEAKRAALDCFVTQIGPLPGDESGTTILPPAALAHFLRPFEVFFT